MCQRHICDCYDNPSIQPGSETDDRKHQFIQVKYGLINAKKISSFMKSVQQPKEI